MFFMYTAPKTPAAFAGQRVRLERARMGDLLKAKIQQRPARQELVRQHILEGKNISLIFCLFFVQHVPLQLTHCLIHS